MSAKAQRLHERALRAHAEGRFEEARLLCARAVRLLERECEEGAADLANVLNTYGSIHQDLGLYAEAEGVFRRSVVLAEALGDAWRIFCVWRGVTGRRSRFSSAPCRWPNRL
jgi:tetratricopeptide (TPR) repeat protein